MTEASDSGGARDASVVCPICQTHQSLPQGRLPIAGGVTLTCSLCETPFSVAATGEVAVLEAADAPAAAGAEEVKTAPLPALDAAGTGPAGLSESLFEDDAATVVEPGGAFLSQALGKDEDEPAESSESGPYDAATVVAKVTPELLARAARGATGIDTMAEASLPEESQQAPTDPEPDAGGQHGSDAGASRWTMPSLVVDADTADGTQEPLAGETAEDGPDETTVGPPPAEAQSETAEVVGTDHAVAPDVTDPEATVVAPSGAEVAEEPETGLPAIGVPEPPGDLAAAIDSEVEDISSGGVDPQDISAFEGNLENLSAVDVLQLLHANRKTGILTVEGPSGRATLSIKEGSIVGCQHPTEAMAIGQIVVEMGLVTHDDVQAALEQQGRAGEARVPLVATLVEQDKLAETDGARALEKLVEATVVEVVSWTEGRFDFRQCEIDVTDSFRHVPAGLKATIDLDVQATLMDALRIVDERARTNDIAEGADLADLLEPSADDTTVTPEPKVNLDAIDDLEFAFEGEALGIKPGEATATDLAVPPDEAQPPPVVVPSADQLTPDASTEERGTSSLAALMRSSPVLVIGASAIVGVILALLVLAVVLAGDDEDAAGTAEQVAADEQVLDLPEPDQQEAAVEAGESPASVDEVEAVGSDRPPRKAKRKRRTKAKSARSLFDAALKKK